MRAAFAGVAAMLLAGSAAAMEPKAAVQAVDASIAKNWAGLDALYKDIHAHPELAFTETRSAAILAKEMRALGFTVTEGVGKTGVVAILKNGAGPVIMVRTEMDGLPMEEKTGLAYASRVQVEMAGGGKSFVAESCGHDNHMAWWIGTARALVAMKSAWQGTVMFIAQPAEEIGAGAKAMLADGLFTKFPKPDFAIGAHVGSAESGTVGVKDGAATSNSDTLEILFKGRGAHGSIPSASIDPIVMGAHFVSDVQTVVSREKEAGSFGVVTVGSFQGGTVPNIIPDNAMVKLSIRSFSTEVRTRLLDGVTRTAKGAAIMAGAPEPEIRHPNALDAVMNDHKLAVQAADYLTKAGGDTINYVRPELPGWSASEDFSAYVEAGVPSLFYSIGGYDADVIADYATKGQPVPTNHSPFFAPNHDKAIRTGVRTLTLTVLMLAPAS
ncbi:amidohydrolase [Sphingomonas sp. BIUV-7]|uniref:Amidohydrolase n=1 Tax=Sphingomonas natans TaxID=3063330 RepID=A0ABT8YBZ1_9SPHN|nr:amidohydrolase [Sphingomonas sp. BIUV-7]MDO6415850.1 amidohydrolase [Sphingomonas sp. BIUV-7]